MASDKLPCSFPGVNGRALRQPVIAVTAMVANVDSSHVCLLMSARTLVFCLRVTMRPGRRLMASW